MQSLANITPLKPAARAGAIQITGVSQVFRTSGAEVVALSDVSLEIKPGRFVVLVGPSGCGKSTLMKLVTGLLPSTRGEVRVDQRRADDALEDLRGRELAPVPVQVPDPNWQMVAVDISISSSLTLEARRQPVIVTSPPAHPPEPCMTESLIPTRYWTEVSILSPVPLIWV